MAPATGLEGRVGADFDDDAGLRVRDRDRVAAEVASSDDRRPGMRLVRWLKEGTDVGGLRCISLWCGRARSDHRSR